MKTRTIVACSALLCSVVAPAMSNDETAPKTDLFATLDVDSDGQLSKEEVSGSSGLSSSFSMIDRNSDGYISKGEFRRNVRSKPDR